MAENPKDRVGRTKPGVSTFPLTALFEAARATKHGADKYGPFNWREIPITTTVYVDAAIGHIAAFFEGEDLDPDSGEHHLAHAIAGLAILRDAQMHGTAIDDRPPPTEPGWHGRRQTTDRTTTP